MSDKSENMLKYENYNQIHSHILFLYLVRLQILTTHGLQIFVLTYPCIFLKALLVLLDHIHKFI